MERNCFCQHDDINQALLSSLPECNIARFLLIIPIKTFQFFPMFAKLERIGKIASVV